ncbi:gas vesicle protein [uncultured Thiohalocapsa sp.]|uniref:gas vesicle protein n=1 Tax=uncultured Thiohalocapsa sp. TaxID=768990 RepID=UPI0025DCE32A|nr:gas vesicle protein [uncultured Thiohalocapsa sp.]
MAVTVNQRSPSHSTSSTTVADLLERVLDKGVVVAGDIRVKLVEVELLSLEIRLLICSVDKAVEMGLDWWRGNPAFDTSARGRPPAAAADAPAPERADQPQPTQPSDTPALEERLARIEALLAERPPTAVN